MEEAARQKIYRQRQAAKVEQMRNALLSIIDRLEGNDKPVAVELRAIAAGGLPLRDQLERSIKSSKR